MIKSLRKIFRGIHAHVNFSVEEPRDIAEFCFTLPGEISARFLVFSGMLSPLATDPVFFKGYGGKIPS
jgi:hypothetical protein